MSRQSVYDSLKAAIEYRGFPYHHFEDECCTIAFASLEQFGPFDSFLSGINTGDDLKLCIYAERVGDRTDGVAVTVSDEVQHLGYWDMYLDMGKKVAAFEDFISRLFRLGCNPADYDYLQFPVELPLRDYERIATPLKEGILLKGKHRLSQSQDCKIIQLAFE